MRRMFYLERNDLGASLVDVGTLDLELLRDHLCQPGRYLRDFAIASRAQRRRFKTALALHVTGQALRDRGKEESPAAHAPEQVAQGRKVQAGRRRELLVVVGDSLSTHINFCAC